MSEQLSEPPPYPSDHKTLQCTEARPASALRESVPALGPLPSMMSAVAPNEALRSSLDVQTRHDSKDPPYTPFRTVMRPTDFPSVPVEDPGQRTESFGSGNAMSIDSNRRDQSASIEDADDRMAAEVLAGLGKADSTRAIKPQAPPPSGYETPLKFYPLDLKHTSSSISTTTNPDGEPILSLLTSSHPWLGGTISGSMSAYASTKSHSPRFIRHSADLIEKHIGSPMANTVGSVGRRTGVEGSLRKYLGSGTPSRQQRGADMIDPDLLRQETSNKRRKISSEHEDTTMDVPVHRTLSGNMSVDSLPVYDENRSPPYEASEPSSSLSQQQRQPPASRSWSTQLMISTSGLGAALNEASLRSLKYVLNILRSANTRVKTLMEALKSLLKDYEEGRLSSTQQQLEEGSLSEKHSPREKSDQNHRDTAPSEGSIIAKRIQALNAEIWQTLKAVVNTVSKYTGGALPENASVIVRWQLMSVPRRWQKAVKLHGDVPARNSRQGGVSSSTRPSDDNGQNGDEKKASQQSQSQSAKQTEKEALMSAHRMLAFALEGIDMMEQVGGVVDSTISSAERWLDSMGRRGQERSHEQERGGEQDRRGERQNQGREQRPESQPLGREQQGGRGGDYDYSLQQQKQEQKQSQEQQQEQQQSEHLQEAVEQRESARADVQMT